MGPWPCRTPQEVAAAVAFYITGQCLAVDGGFLINGL
jgi:hypothetical protein